jgi:hypothetical protein
MDALNKGGVLYCYHHDHPDELRGLVFVMEDFDNGFTVRKATFRKLKELGLLKVLESSKWHKMYGVNK